jgi:RNA polymerase sigma-70 factor (ECF subfamily)
LAQPTSQNVTQMLLAWSEGDQAARDQLIPVVYDELRRLAHHYMRRESPGRTLQTTALVNEAYLRLVDGQRVRWQNRVHFFSISARLMRRILVDSARAHRYQKRGGGMQIVPLDDAVEVTPEPSRDLVALDDALKTLSSVDPRKSQVVELRYFGGLTAEETAEALGVSPDTVLRDWRLAKAWLGREMRKTTTAKRSTAP